MKYFTKEEVSIHNHPESCWVVIFDQVFDVTELVMANRGPLAKPLVEAGGMSISDWFDEKTGDLRTFMDPVRGIEMPYTPTGRFVHVPPPDPMDDAEMIALPWWKNKKYIIGKVTKNTMKIRITNMLTHYEDVIKICQEETVGEIRTRYQEYNLNSKSYTWKTLTADGQFVEVNLNRTLEENGIRDESDNYARYGMDEETGIPSLHIYYDDDLNIA